MQNKRKIFFSGFHALLIKNNVLLNNLVFKIDIIYEFKMLLVNFKV